MVYLQDADNASRLFALDSGGVRRLSPARSRLLKRTAARNVSGHRGHIAGRPAAVYVAGGRLWLAIDDHAWLLGELSAEVDQADDGYAVQISTPERDYRLLAHAASFDGDTTPFAALEDFSFGLWVARIIESRERQKVLLQQLVDAPLDQVPDHAEKPVDASHAWGGPTQASHAPNRGASTQ
jgi:hypothetical protein